MVYLVGTNTRQHLHHKRPLTENVSDHLNGCYKTTDIHGCRSGMETLPACIELVCLTRREICPLRDSLEKRQMTSQMVVKVFGSNFSPQIRVVSRFHNMAKGSWNCGKPWIWLKKKEWNLYPGVLPYKKYGGAHHTFRDGQLEKRWGVGGTYFS